MDRLLSLHTALTETAAASAFYERAVLLHDLGHGTLAMADAQHALRLDPTYPEAMALLCRLGAGTASEAELQGVAQALLQSPFARHEDRRQALSVLDPAALPVMLPLDQPLGVRLTIVQRQGESLKLKGSDQRDQILPLGQDKHRQTVAFDCHFARPNSGTRQITVLSENARPQIVTVGAVASPEPVPAVDARRRAPIWIIMPLKDGGEVLQRCLRSVLDELSRLPGAQLMLVDDCSEQAATRHLLARCATHSGVSVIRTSSPLGFTGAVNQGLQQIGIGPVLLLNSDVWLPPGTLAQMLSHLEDPDVGTVTPLSNNAGSVCLLGPGRAARMPEPDVCNRLAEAALRYNRGMSVDLPNGNGFAMLLAEQCLQDVGPLSGLYESGYYEEVDFCLRASLRGWRHVAAVDCFVGHVGSVTYGAEKNRLANANFRRLVQRFPDYPAVYRRFASLNVLAPFADRLLTALAADWTPEEMRDIPQHPGIEDIILPVLDRGPRVLPFQGDLPGPLLHHRFRQLRLVRQAALAAAGMTLRPGHDLVATADMASGQVTLRDKTAGKTLAQFDSIGASSADFADFELSMLDLLAKTNWAGGDRAVSF